MLLVGLTGGIGAGKSTVSRLLAERGAVVIDADAVARDVVEPGPTLDALVARFGAGILGPDGHLDRSSLAAVAFADAESTAALNAITHPAIDAEVTRRIAAAPSDAIVVCDVPLLAESARARNRGYQVVVVVEAPLEVRLDRLEGRGLARDDATARIAAQATDDERRALADIVVDNGGDVAALEPQVDALWADLRVRAGG